MGYFYYSENLNWAAQNLRLNRGLDIAGIDVGNFQRLQNLSNLTLLLQIHFFIVFS